MVKKLRAENYIRLFEVTGRITCLHSEFFVETSLGLGDPLIVYKEGVWRSFMTREGEKLCLKKGLEIFSDKERYHEYSNGFRDYIKMAKGDILPRFSEPRDISKSEFEEILPMLRKLCDYYGITEFSYHELAYEQSLKTNDPILKSNLDDLGKLKFEGREILYAYMSENGVFHNFLHSIGRKFLADPSGAIFLFYSELLGLFDGKNISNEILDRRKKCYGCNSIGGTVSIFSSQEASDIWDEFCGTKKDQLITGTVANRGHALGYVVIAPMLLNMQEVMKIDATMKEGDVLVAESTSPEFMSLFKKTSAIVTNQGGMLSHAAVLSREFNIPCIVGTGNATHVLKNGDFVKVDANNGVVSILQKGARKNN